ncbi:hypothetical protein N7451_012664 [Penicillium sp. IBT 35674x]|nr:hypothetical protein N7451_012664 [Penicillium sp. IBT 35674x]
MNFFYQPFSLSEGLTRAAQLNGLLGPTGIVLALLGLCVLLVIFVFDTTDVPYIGGLPSAAGVPIFGNLIQLGVEHPKRLADLSEKYGPVFQIRLGNRRFIVANSFETAKELWIKNQSNLIFRPTLHTFHNVLSGSEAFTIGTSPWDETCKRRRKAAATAVNRPSVASYVGFIDLESLVSISELASQIHGKKSQVDLNPYALFQRLALNLSLTLGYGFRIGGNSEDNLLREIVTVERGISTLRSTSNNWQDFIPMLRILPKGSDRAADLRERRDKYLEFLLDRLKDHIAQGTDKPCITGNILKDPEYVLTHTEIKSICLTMIAGGLDTTPACILFGTAMLSGPQGQELQRKLLDEIKAKMMRGKNDSWKRNLSICPHFAKKSSGSGQSYRCPFHVSALRTWTTKGARIPAGTTFLMNAWASNYDPEHHESPHTFAPERFLNMPEGAGTLHFAFGAGSRMCTGSHLAMREMYVTFVRLVVAFEVLPARNPSRRPILTGPLECNANPSGLSIEPRDFDLGFKVRDEKMLHAWFEQSEKATEHLLV